ncbi:sulfatase [Ramlibacter albus]|uniref:Sulfatase n=1 Tax=Ramlibacter albus TaxID=2079448 RepID=A0A923MC20_9BURK|nr:sulfatase [Ramlibacter albus]MBC5766766.1 sulfatase [Ramlibacter albus]
MRFATGLARRNLLAVAVAALLGGCAAVQAPLQASAPATAPRPAANRPMNVLLIIADDQNARLGTYGAPVRSPNVDRFAREGVRFEHAYANFPLCGPSRASFLSGVRPNTIGAKMDFMKFRCAMPDVTTLPQYFKDRGWFAGRIGKAYHQGVPSDIGRSGPDDAASWTQVVNPRGHDKDVEGDVLNLTPGTGLGRALAFLEGDKDDADYTDGKVATAAIEMMKANANKPFFITVGFYRPHVPEIVPKKYFDLYPMRDIPAPDATPEELAALVPTSRLTANPHFGMTPEQQRQMIRAYSAATTFMDAQVGRVLESLDKLDLRDNTIVVFMGDHGFMLGQHGQWTKSMLFEESARTALIVRAPQVQGGRASAKPVELVDLYPTITDLAGLPRYARNEGSSLVPLLERPDDPQWTKPALSQVFGGRSVRTERYRYTEWDQGRAGRELYDYTTDPAEKHNLAADPAHAATIARLKAMLPAGPVEARRVHPEDGGQRYGSRAEAEAAQLKCPES